jgi:phosphoglycerol transferase MdoB-like AlkP superfamily enzyme
MSNEAFLWGLFFALPMVLPRFYLYASDYDQVSDIVETALRGVLSDGLVAFFVGYSLSLLTKHKGIKAVLWTPFLLLGSFNMENIRVNVGNLDLRDFDQSVHLEFIDGSVMSVRVILGVIVNLIMSILIFKGIQKYFEFKKFHIEKTLKIHKVNLSFTFFSIAAILMVLVSFNPVQRGFSWIRYGFFEENLRISTETFGDNIRTSGTAYLPEDLKARLYEINLNAEKIVEYPKQKPNILLVFVESISHTTLMSGFMPEIKKYGQSNLLYSQYIGLQKHTNRGLFSTLCGEYPNIVRTEFRKPDIFLTKGLPHPCLPQNLKNLGYQTEFLQAARLSFMQKNRLMKKMGYEKIVGDDSLRKGETIYGRNGWGVDDRSLYEYAYSEIKLLNEKSKPWFLSVLTAGTHHPFNVPGNNNSSYESAVRYSDKYLAELVRKLKKDGIDKNTLIILTTDEAQWSDRGAGFDNFAANHGYLIIDPPGENKQKLQSDIFSQADIPASIMDYLGYPDKVYYGRSLFRDYKGKKRTLIFGNHYIKESYFLDQDHLLRCAMPYNCTHYKLVNNNFPISRPVGPAKKEDIETLKKIVKFNDWKASKEFLWSEKDIEKNTKLLEQEIED